MNETGERTRTPIQLVDDAGELISDQVFYEDVVHFPDERRAVVTITPAMTAALKEHFG